MASAAREVVACADQVESAADQAETELRPIDVRFAASWLRSMGSTSAVSWSPFARSGTQLAKCQSRTGLLAGAPTRSPGSSPRIRRAVRLAREASDDCPQPAAHVSFLRTDRGTTPSPAGNSETHRKRSATSGWSTLPDISARPRAPRTRREPKTRTEYACIDRCPTRAGVARRDRCRRPAAEGRRSAG